MKKSVTISVETSGRSGSVAIGIDDEILEETRFSGQLKHNAELFTAIKELLGKYNYNPDQIDNIYCVIGPGSFTGIRISVTLAKMYALAVNARVTAVNTMDALRLNADDYETDTGTQVHRLATVIDAKRGLFFAAVFEKHDNNWVKTTDDTMIKSQDFVKEFCRNKTVWMLGEGLVFYKDDFACENVKFLPEKYWPARAKNVYLIGQQLSKQNVLTDPAKLVPFYLRGPDAKPKKGLK